MIRKFFTYIAAVAAMATASSCANKELCYMHPHTAQMKINVDWSEFVAKEVPTGMTVIVYPQNGNTPITTKSNTISHVLVNLPAGYYNSIVFNQSETEFGTLQFRNLNDYNTAEVTALQAPTKWYNTKDHNERIVHEPEWFGTDNHQKAEVTQEMIDRTTQDYTESTGSGTGTGTRTTKGGIDLMLMKPLNVIYTINVTVHIKNIQHLRSARAALEGVAEGYMLGTGKRSANQATHLMEEWHMSTSPEDPTRGTITAKLHCFGLPHGHKATPQENIFNLSLLLADNKTIVNHTFEVGDQFIEDDTHHLTLYLIMELPSPLPDVKPETGQGGGFEATVTDWSEEIEHNVEI